MAMAMVMVKPVQHWRGLPNPNTQQPSSRFEFESHNKKYNNNRKKGRLLRHERTNAVAQQADKWWEGISKGEASKDATESEAFIYDLISCTFDITIAVNASSF